MTNRIKGFAVFTMEVTHPAFARERVCLEEIDGRTRLPKAQAEVVEEGQAEVRQGEVVGGAPAPVEEPAAGVAERPKPAAEEATGKGT